MVRSTLVGDELNRLDFELMQAIPVAVILLVITTIISINDYVEYKKKGKHNVTKNTTSL